MNPDDLIAEARAKIIWGEISPSVHDFLTANGISDIDADAKIKELNAERNREIRKLGIKRTFFGAALVAGAGIFFYYSFEMVDLDEMEYFRAKAFVGTAIVVAIAGFYRFIPRLVEKRLVGIFITRLSSSEQVPIGFD